MSTDIKMEVSKTYDLKLQPKDLSLNGSNGKKSKFTVKDEFPHLILAPDQYIDDTQPLNLQDNAQEYESKDIIQENIKSKASVVNLPSIKLIEVSGTERPVDMKFKLELNSNDLTKEHTKQNLSNDCDVDKKIKQENEQDTYANFVNCNICMGSNYSRCVHYETRLDKIPRHVLGKYGIVVEDSEWWNGLQEEQKDVSDKESEDGGDCGNLVIDEDEIPECKTTCVNENSNFKDEGSNNEVDNSSAKENTSDFTNSGHHLVISSVTSLQWERQCELCAIVLPDENSMEKHKKGHCTFPGCLDFIENFCDMEKHLRVHRSHPQKPFRCDFCMKRFHYYRFSKKHKVLCKVLKKSKCPYCRYTSSKSNQFKKHLERHIVNIPCTDCTKSYTVLKNYRKHMGLNHRKLVVFQCTECPRQFHSPEGICDHIGTHGLSLSECGLKRFIHVRSADEIN